MKSETSKINSLLFLSETCLFLQNSCKDTDFLRIFNFNFRYVWRTFVVSYYQLTSGLEITSIKNVLILKPNYLTSKKWYYAPKI
jgi:hypothetical protein